MDSSESLSQKANNSFFLFWLRSLIFLQTVFIRRILFHGNFFWSDENQCKEITTELNFKCLFRQFVKFDISITKNLEQ